jgi:CDP-glycerol glycerophosphotransferase (TagB/SpsB family)
MNLAGMMSVKVLRYLIYLLFLPVWWLQRLWPRNRNIWIFGAWFGHKYSDNAKVLFEYTLNNHPLVECIWLSRNREIVRRLNDEGKKSALSFSIRGIYWSLRAGCVIYSSGKQDVNPFFINGATIINTWHGAPMKRIGLDDSYADVRKNRWIRTFFPFLWEFNPDAVVSTAEIFNDKLQSAFNVTPANVICSGYPRNDIFYDAEFIHPLYKRWNDKYKKPRMVFYLPTFRNRNENFTPFHSFGFREEVWELFLEQHNTILISKGHFVGKHVGSGSKANRIIHLSDNEIEDLNPLLKDADILITDFSGAYFDFLLTGKPIIFAPFDYDSYITESRQLYFDYNEIVCGPVVRDWNQVITAMEQLFANDTYEGHRSLMNLRFNKYRDSNSSARLFREINIRLNSTREGPLKNKNDNRVVK